MTIQQLITKELRRLTTEKADLEEAISAAPPGALVFSPNHAKGKTYYKWYIYNGTTTNRSKKTYLRRQERERAKALARKGLQKAHLKDIEREITALESYLAKHKESSFLAKLLKSPGLWDLVSEDIPMVSSELSEELEKWVHDDYEMNPLYPERKIVPTDQGIMVRSKSEAIILMLLSINHIPFRYECRLEVSNRTYYPDFTIRHPITGETFYWEHVGRLDLPEYRSSFMNKLNVYLNNGIIPDQNLILTYESEDSPLNIAIVMDKIEEFFFCNKSPVTS